MRARLLCLFALLPAAARAELPYEVPYAQTPPRIDGALDEALWKNASPLAYVSFFPHPDDKRRSIRIAWGEEGLYWAADLDDAGIRPFGAHHNDTLWHGDVAELFLKPSAQAPTYYEFQVNPEGRMLEFIMPGSKGQQRMQAAAKRREGGWRAEALIPWQALGGMPKEGDIWRFNAAFYDYPPHGQPLLGATAPLSRPSFHRLEEYGRLRFSK